MKTEILKLLRESKDYVSGQQLCETFGVSRTAVWKVMNQLKEEGYEVEAVRNRGYRIVGSADVMTQEELESLLDGRTKWAGQHVVYYDEIDSTNIKAKQLGEEGAPHGTLVVADMQTALRTCTGLDVQIKWPNDIILNGKKIVGILTEMSTEIDYINHVVIGVGINVNTETFPEEIADKATSLRIEIGEVQKRAPIVAEIMSEFEKCYEEFEKQEDLSFIQEEYN